MGAVRHMVPDLQAYVMALTTVGREVISWEMVTMALAPTAREALRIRDDYSAVTTERDAQGYYLLPGDGFSANAEDLTDQVLRATGREYTPEQIELCLGELVRAPRPQRGGSRRVTRGKLVKTRGGLVQFDADLIHAYPSAIEERLIDCLLASDVYLEGVAPSGVMRISLGTARQAAGSVPGDTVVRIPMRQIFYAHRWGTISTPGNLARLVTKAHPVHADTGVVTMPLCEYVKVHGENTERARRRAVADRVPDVECSMETGNVAEAMDRFRERLLKVMDSLPVYASGAGVSVNRAHRCDSKVVMIMRNASRRDHVYGDLGHAQLVRWSKLTQEIDRSPPPKSCRVGKRQQSAQGCHRGRHSGRKKTPAPIVHQFGSTLIG